MSPQPTRTDTAAIANELRKLEPECFDAVNRADFEALASAIWAEYEAEDERTAHLEEVNERLRARLYATEQRMALMSTVGSPVILALLGVCLWLWFGGVQ